MHMNFLKVLASSYTWVYWRVLPLDVLGSLQYYQKVYNIIKINTAYHTYNSEGKKRHAHMHTAQV